MSRSTTPPSHRKRTVRNRLVAIVTLRDSKTGCRRDYRLGPWGTDESHEKYARVLAAWESAGRRLPDSDRQTVSADALTITMLCHRYWAEVVPSYAPREQLNMKLVIRLLRELYGSLPAESLGPCELRLVRDAMISRDPNAVRPHRGWARGHINGQVGRIRRIFRWAASHVEVVSIPV